MSDDHEQIEPEDESGMTGLTTPPDIEIVKAVPFEHPEPMFEDFKVPDVIGEIIGWRAWNVIPWSNNTLHRLQSLGAGGGKHATIWEPKKGMEAYCAKDHEVPDERCSCGFYAANTREHLVGMGYNRYDVESPTGKAVIGRVAMWGKVIPGTQGWRAQYARPIELFVPYVLWKLVKPLEAEYAVPVKLSNTFKADEGGDESGHRN